MGGFHDRLPWQDVSNLCLEGLGCLGFDAEFSCGNDDESGIAAVPRADNIIGSTRVHAPLSSLNFPVSKHAINVRIVRSRPCSIRLKPKALLGQESLELSQRRTLWL